MSNKNNGRRNAGRGYYIALILCALAIGISGYVIYQGGGEPPKDPAQVLDATLAPEGEDVQAVATQPGLQTLPTGTEPTKPVVTRPIRTAAPVQGNTVADYAMEALSYNPTTRDWRTHDGIDIAAEAGTPVCAAADGTVTSSYEDETMGYTVVIDHADGYTTCYSSLGEKPLVAVGDQVRMGQTIGCVGQSALLESAIGDHVHFSVTRDGACVDPEAFLGWI